MVIFELPYILRITPDFGNLPYFTKKTGSNVIFIVEEKQRYHCIRKVIAKIYKDHFLNFVLV